MTSEVVAAAPRPAEASAAGESIRLARLDWLVAGLAVWLVGGFYLDLWAHRHGIVDDTFLTPWHAVLYTGAASFGVVLGLLGVVRMTPGAGIAASLRRFVDGLVRDRRARPTMRALLDAIPAGYRVSFLGALLFIVAGSFDFAWHTAFGFELNVEALLSPPHLLLASAGVLMSSGPLRSIWYRPGRAITTWLSEGPAVVSLILVFAIFAAFTQYANPISHTLADLPDVTGAQSAETFAMEQPFVRQGWGAAGVLVHAALLAGFALAALRRRTLPAGALALLMAVPTLMMAFVVEEWRFVPGAIVAGIVAEIVTRTLGFGRSRRVDLVVAFTIPAAWFSAYFATVSLTVGLGWSVSLWAGAIFLAGAIGLLLNELTRSGLGLRAEGL